MLEPSSLARHTGKMDPSQPSLYNPTSALSTERPLLGLLWWELGVDRHQEEVSFASTPEFSKKYGATSSQKRTRTDTVFSFSSSCVLSFQRPMTPITSKDTSTRAPCQRKRGVSVVHLPSPSSTFSLLPLTTASSPRLPQKPINLDVQTPSSSFHSFHWVCAVVNASHQTCRCDSVIASQWCSTKVVGGPSLMCVKCFARLQGPRSLHFQLRQHRTMDCIPRLFFFFFVELYHSPATCRISA